MRIFLSGGLQADSKTLERLKSEVKPSCHIHLDLPSDDQPETGYYDFYLYLISPVMKGIRHIVQLVDDSNKKPKRTIYCFIDQENGEEFSRHQLKSLKAIAEIVKRNGGTWIESLENLIEFLNAKS